MSNKKHKRDVGKLRSQESDIDASFYFDIEENTLSTENFELFQHAPTTYMASAIPKDDLNKIAYIISVQIKCDLIKQIKSELLTDIKILV